MSEKPRETGTSGAQIRVEQTATEVRGKMTGVEIHQFYGEIIVRPESIEDLPPAPGEPPYKGLTYYTEDDADIFFGREDLTAKLADRLQETRFLAVVGASGSGKSSLLRAGVVPELRKQNWAIHMLTPTAHPLRQLATSLTRDDASLAAAGDLRQALAGDPQALPLAIDKLAARANRSHLLLLIDQFEETFTLCKDEGERQAFLDCLQAAAAAEGAATVLIGVRADFYDRCLQYEGLRRVLAEQQEPMGPMTEEELVRVIAEPAKRGGWQFVEGLVEQMLEDVGQEPGRLPLLSHALRETWERRRGTVMTLAGYRAVGGVEGAIAESAEDVLENLSDERVKVVRNIFLALTELGEGSADTRRIADAHELARLGNEEDVAAVIERLVRARLVTVDEGQVEVAHEALIRRWHRLQEWLEDNRERLRFERQLAQDARGWVQLERDPSALYRGARLARAVEWQDEQTGERLDPLTETFLEASRDLAEAEAREEESRRQRELEQAQKLATEAEARREAEAERARAEEERAAEAALRAEEAEDAAGQLRRRRNIAFGLAAGALALAVAAVILFGQSNRNAARAQNNLATATRALVVAESERIRADGNAATAVAESTRAAANFERAATSEAVAETRAAEADANADLAATREAEALLQARLANARTLAAQSAEAANKSFQRSLLLAWRAVMETFREDQSVVGEAYVSLVRTLITDRGYSIALGHRGPVSTAAFSRDAGRVITASWDGGARVWDAASILSGDGASALLAVLAGHTDGVSSAAFSPDGERVVTTSYDGTASVWDTAGTLLADLEGPYVAVYSAAFSPDGGRLVTVGCDGIGFDGDCLSVSAQLWDVDGETIAGFDGHAVAFSPDGELMVTVGYGNTARLRDASGNLLHVLEGHTAPVVAATFSPDSERALTAGQDGTARMWDAEGTLVAVFEGHTDIVNSVAFSADGTRVATASNDGTARLWDASGNQLYVLEGHADDVNSAAFSADGKRVVTASNDGTARLWDANGGLLKILEGHTDSVNFATFSPDGKQVLTASQDGTARVWDVRRAPVAVLDGHTGTVNAVAFSHDGERAVTAGTDGVARLWDLQGALIAILAGHSGELYATSFSPDGTRVVTASFDGTARLWDVSGDSGAEVAAVLEGHAGPVNATEFSPDGTLIVTASDDGTARLWDAAGDLLSVLEGHSEPVISAAFSPDRDRVVTASWDGTAGLWNTEGTLIDRFGWRRNEYFSAAGFSADGKWVLTVSSDGSAQLWGAEEQSTVLLEEPGHEILSASSSPNGEWIVTGSNDGNVWLWDTAGNVLQVLEGHTAPVVAAAFSPDGERIITASADGTARLWDVSGILSGDGSGDLLAVLEGSFGEVHLAAFSPDGEHLVTAGDDSMVRVWDAHVISVVPSLQRHVDAVSSGTFGTAVSAAVADDDGTARVRVAGLDSLLVEARRQLLPMVTLEECKMYFPDDCPPNATEVPLP